MSQKCQRSRPGSLLGMEASGNDTLYLCNFRVSVDGDWLCLKELPYNTGCQSSDETGLLAVGSDDTKSCIDNLAITPELEKMTHYPSYPLANKDRDPVQIEKSNLINILKLVIKEVIDSSLKFGRQLDSDHIPLQHFFIVIEHILRHGLRPKKGILGPKNELWDLLQMVEKKDVEAMDITASVRELPTVKTPIGRTRAWLRLAVMQKKMADYFRVLMDQGHDLLADFYEPKALIRSEEAILVSGLLVSLNLVDCNLCVKEEDLDSQQGVIDFSLYLRNNKDALSDTNEQPENLTAVLDQKHYIEEINRHLNATVANLQVQIENLSATNALMKEDLTITRGALQRSQFENKKLLAKIEQSFSDPASNFSVNDSAPSDTYYMQKFIEEKRKCEDLQKELKLQKSMKAEMEMAMKLLEKDVHDKKDTIGSLRDQLSEIKTINMDMYTKLQECETEIAEKGELVKRLESKTVEISRMLDRLNLVSK